MISVLVRRSCGDPVEIILKRSLHKDPEDALRWHMSSGIFIGSASMKFLWNLLYRESFFDDLLTFSSLSVPVWASGMFWYEVLMSRRSVAFRSKTNSCCCSSDITCCCSIATVACIWSIDFLRPHCLGSFAGVTFAWHRSINFSRRFDRCSVLAHTRHNTCDVPKLFEKYAKSPFDPKLGTQKLDIKHKTGDCVLLFLSCSCRHAWQSWLSWFMTVEPQTKLRKTRAD